MFQKSRILQNIYKCYYIIYFIVEFEIHANKLLEFSKCIKITTSYMSYYIIAGNS